MDDLKSALMDAYKAHTAWCNTMRHEEFDMNEAQYHVQASSALATLIYMLFEGQEMAAAFSPEVRR